MAFVCQAPRFCQLSARRIFTGACKHSVCSDQPSMSMSKSRSPIKRDTSIPRRPLLWLAAALLFTLPPLFDSLATWVPCLFLLSLALKFWMEPRGYRLRFTALNLALVAVALAVIFASYGSVKGLEPAISLLVVLISLKVLEAHTAREFQVMVMMDRGSSPGAIWPPLATTGKLLAQAAPLVALLFLLFPRINTGFRFEFRPIGLATSGFSDRLSPGSVAALANSSDIVFRAEFPGSKTPPPGPMYWRGIVMWHCDGMEWRAPYSARSIASGNRRTGEAPSANSTRQRITIAPHGAHWMFALDRPFEIPPGAMLARGDYLWSVQSIRKARRYEIVSSYGSTGKELTPQERKEALDLPPSISPDVRELAQSWTAQSSSPRATINSALHFFRTQGFRYSLSPGEYRKNDLEQFLFHRRVGFCEHYAAS
ncbi:MAG: DUF3488 domain-containing protein, partial [Chloroflexi bacterium]